VYDPNAIDLSRLAPGGVERAQGINGMLMAWLEAAMSFFNDSLQRRAYEEIFLWIRKHRGERLYSYRSRNGYVGYIRNPSGVLVIERWSEPPDSRIKAFRDSSIFGWGSTPGSAFVQGKNMPSLRSGPDLGDFYRYVFFDLRRLQVLGSKHYRPEIFRLDRGSGLLERSLE
jgi:hypothetical protein